MPNWTHVVGGVALIVGGYWLKSKAAAISHIEVKSVSKEGTIVSLLGEDNKGKTVAVYRDGGHWHFIKSDVQVPSDFETKVDTAYKNWVREQRRR